MARSKHTCKILKDIRRRIAEANDIELITSECQFQEDCLGTCPKCEAEVRYLETQLAIRRMAGNAIVLAGLSVGMLTMSSCSNQQKNAATINPEYDEEYNVDVQEITEDDEYIEGEMEINDYYNDPAEAAAVTPEKESISEILVCGDPEFDEEEFFRQRDSIKQAEFIRQRDSIKEIEQDSTTLVE